MTPLPFDATRGPSQAQLSGFIALAIFIVVIIAFSWRGDSFAQMLGASCIGIASIQSVMLYGRRHALALFAICMCVVFPLENFGSLTGLLFGSYHFAVGADLPHVGVIPIIVGPLWYGMGYFSWIVAGVILGGAHARLDSRFTFYALPLVAAFAMTQWDLVMDPPLSTLEKAWVWHDGGAFFGVPFSNFLSWLLTSWLFFQGYAIYLSRQPAALASARRASRSFLALSILLYASAGLTHLTPWLLHPTGQAADASGRLWDVMQLRESAVAIMLFTMFFSALLALLRLYGEERGDCR